ncbi:hypothetical protein QBC40DRAFT_13811 [Triangularia verruculosa]|uniref:Myb-like domain-containing protein n=1 Tax=Triangularia verruculosa TaxID=2587418 RepID=A0AAN6X8F0_9PEZI|nr:hypothetical protein QBC40DRAFT_13811 [Triangularia verruculosa]
MSRPRGLGPPARSAEHFPSIPLEKAEPSRGWYSSDHADYRGEPSHAPQHTSHEPSWQYSLQSIMAPPVSHNDSAPPISKPPGTNDESGAIGSGKNRADGRGGGMNHPQEDDIVVPEYPHSAYNYGTWSAADDRTLVLARSRGKHWVELQRSYFPTKTANACRKRYERLMERRGALEQDSQRLERISHEYMALRKQMWTPLADRVGEKWEVVEAACMSAGIRTIQSNARSHTNRWRRDSRASQKGREVPLPFPLDPHHPGLPLPPPSTGSIGVAGDFEQFASSQGPLGGSILSDLGQTTDSHHAPRDAELMPPPPFPSSGSIPPQPIRITEPSIPFAGYLHVRSTRRPNISHVRSEGRNPEQDLGWHTTNPFKPR